MITDDKKWYYLALKSVCIFDGKKWRSRPVRSLSRLLRGITSNHNGDFYCLTCFHSYHTDNKLKRHERLCNNYDNCQVEMSKVDEIILKYNYGEK